MQTDTSNRRNYGDSLLILPTLVGIAQEAPTSIGGEWFTDCITGVAYRKNREIYEVRVVITRSNVVYVGSFKNIEDAVLAYNNYVIEHKLNKKLNII